ncbi:MAG: hypothetical protein FJ387_03100 [Verrucomicrobia bacterium]|nr:hypothetical protein [Verrucomicrobiota bacterium]
MKSEGILRHLAVVALASVLFYVGGFWGVQTWRERQGPWEVTFSADAAGNPTVEINQARLGIRQVRLVFAGAPARSAQVPKTIRFTDPEARVRIPFGSVVFLDTTVLPGTVTLTLFGHEIELLPRVLIVDKREHAWTAGLRLDFERS